MDFFEKKVECLGVMGEAGTVLAGIDDDPAATLSLMSPEEIEEIMFKFFKEQDGDGNRTLDRQEFKMVFNNLGNKLGLKTNDIRRILAEADQDENGQVSFAEFIPVAVSIIETIIAKCKLRENEKVKAKVQQDAHGHIYHGMPSEDLNEILTTIFQEADTDGNGTLDAEEFARCLTDIRIGMTRKEINVLMFETYADKEGKVDYEAFKPLCMDLLVEMTAQEWMAPDQDEKDLEEKILSLFESETSDSRFQNHHVQRVLHKADLGLTLVQICSILSEAEEDDAGLIDITEFAPKAAFMIHACQNYRKIMSEKRVQIETLHSSEGWGYVLGRDRDTLEHDLLEAFEDMDEQKMGVLPREDIKSCLKATLDIDKKTIHALLSLAHMTETGEYRYKPIVTEAFRTLKKLLELAIIFED